MPLLIGDRWSRLRHLLCLTMATESSVPVWRVFKTAVASRVLVAALALASSAVLDHYDSSSRYDVPNTALRCELSDGDEKFPQARRDVLFARPAPDCPHPEGRARAGSLRRCAGAPAALV